MHGKPGKGNVVMARQSVTAALVVARTALISQAVLLRQPALVIGSQLTPQSIEAAGTGVPMESTRLSSHNEPAPPGQSESLEHHRTQYCVPEGPRQVNPAAHGVDASHA